MSYLALHTGEDEYPHCTLAHWETLSGIRDAHAYAAILQIIGDKAIPHEINLCIEGESMFGKQAVWLLGHTTILTHLRRYVRHLDERSSASQWTPHVSRTKRLIPSYETLSFRFEYLGLHTRNLRTNYKIHHYWRL